MDAQVAPTRPLSVQLDADDRARPFDHAREVANQNVRVAEAVGLPGQVKEMDDLAKELATCAPRCHRTCAPARPSEAPLNARRARGRSSDKTAVVKKAEGVAAAIDAKSADAAKYYVKVMKKVVEGGAGFIGKETKRLQKMMDDGSVKADKKEQFGRRLNALSSFA